MSEPTSGTGYRSLINGQEIKYERSVSFEPDEIKIIIYTNFKEYHNWLNRKGEKVNFKMTGTDIDIERIIDHVIIIVELEEVVQVLVKLVSLKVIEERKRLL